MIYVVKCYSCEHEFKVKRGETGADMICPECGTANNIRDVVERIEDASEKVDSDVQAIKSFDIEQHPVVDDWSGETRSRRYRNKTSLFEFLENASPGEITSSFIVIVLCIIGLILMEL